MKSYRPAFLHFLVFSLSPLVLAEETIDFNRDIRPLLSDRCFHCHGPDENKREADLRLDTKEGALAPLDDEKKFFALVPGDAEKSELFFRITTDDDVDIMPPTESKLPPFTEHEIELIRKWIEQGGNYSDLWTFVSVEKPAIPESNWGANEIDRFVSRKLEKENLEPSRPADRNTLIRRVTFEITGLPPTPDEVASFLSDASPDAYEKVVDRLLKSNRYGERMAAEWLDASRYADTSGYQYDWFRTMWRWRDWVIDSYNQNQPYDEFITWQLAGDLIPDATLEQKIATGFNRNHPFTIEGGVIDEEYRVSYVSDRVTTMGTVFMGLTLECSRCHDHKFDPISQKDFYQLYAFFNHLPERGFVGGKPLSAPPAIPAPTKEQEDRLAALKKEHAESLAALTVDDSALDQEQRSWEQSSSSPWAAVAPTKSHSTVGTTFKALPDGSLLAEGKAPAKDTYEFTFSHDGKSDLTGIRIDALTHESMVKNGPGRSANGNAVLTGIEIVRLDSNGKEERLKVSKAVADYEQQNYPASNAIDSNAGSGWAFDGNTNHADHWIAVNLENAVPSGSMTSILVRLHFASGFGGHSFGRVKLAVSSLPDPAAFGGDEGLQKLLAKPQGKRSAAESRKIQRIYRSTLPRFKDVSRKLTALENEKKKIESEIPMTMIMSDDSPRETFVLERGQYDKQLEQVSAAVPENLPPLPEGAPANRLGLARWLTSRDHPLTARVTMNRLWHQVFGVGIVKTVNDFGSQAEWPSHQQLLDWLAVEFMESGWDLQHMLKLMVMSSTYQQSSDTSADMLQRDPENRLLARGPRKRMSAEMIRDSALAASGLLSSKIGGPSAKPYQPPGIWKELTNRKNFQQVYEADKGEGLYRRGIYTFWKRAAHHTMMATFDAPNREVCTFSRSTTNTPLQALTLLHDPQFVEAAKVLASQLVANSDRVESRIQQGCMAVLARNPSQQEMDVLRQLYESELKAFRSKPDEAKGMLSVGAASIPAGLDEGELAATTMVVRTILNLSEAITKH